MSKAIYIEDNLFDKTIIDNERYTVRVIIKNKDNLFGYIYINGEDMFGYRDHIESSGGGIEEGETDEDAVKREVLGELGCTCKIVAFIGQIVHDFNLLKRRTYANYYYVEVIDENLETNLTSLEKTLFKGIIWKSLVDIKNILNKETSKVGMLVHKRELRAIELYEKYIKKNGGQNE